MLQERDYILRRMNMALDFALAAAAFFIAFWLREHVLSPAASLLTGKTLRYIPQWNLLAGLLVFMPPLAVAALHWNGCYGAGRFRGRGAISRAMLISVLEAAALAYLLAVVVRSEGRISRVQPAVIAAVLYPLLEIKTSWMRFILRRRRERGLDRRTVLLVGSGKPLEDAAAVLRAHPDWGFDVAGVIDDSGRAKAGELVCGAPVLGGLAEAAEILRSRRIDQAILAPSEARLCDLAPFMRHCEEIGLQTHLSLALFGHVIARPVVEAFHDLPVATFSPVRPTGPAMLVKLLFDRLAAAILLVALSPVFLAVALAIRLTSKRGEPVFFRQERCGLNGKRFICYKFRSMRPGAEEERAALEEKNEADGPVFKMRDDPRVTGAGRLLRRWSLDELPQLWNVLRGDMSLVGPRPPLPSEVERYDPWQRRRLSMRPGVTCLWQVRGRSTLPFRTWMELDLQYIDNWSLWLDFKILALTAYAVVRGRGAM